MDGNGRMGDEFLGAAQENGATDEMVNGAERY